MIINDVRSKLFPRLTGKFVRWINSEEFIVSVAGKELIGQKDYWEGDIPMCDFVSLTDITGTLGEWFDRDIDDEVPNEVITLLRKAYDLAVKEYEK